MGKRFALLLVLMCLISSMIILDKSVSATLTTMDSWKELAPMHVARAHLGIVAVNGKIYAIGGTFSDSTQPVSINEEYNPINNTWTFKEPMPSPRCYFAIAVYENKIYCIGGSNHGVTGLNQVYNTATDSWETKASMLTPRSGLTTNVVNGKIYVMGGLNEDYPPTSA